MRYLGTLLLVAALAGCQTQTKNQAASLAPIEVHSNEKTRPIAFKKVVVKIPRNQTIGAIQGGVFCIRQADLKPRGGRYQINDDMFTDVFRHELESNGYEVVGNPDALFDDPSLSKAEYLIGALITSIEANVCYPMIGFGDVNTQSAAVFLKTDWQIYSTLDRKVVLEAKTEGSYKTNGTAENADQAFENAFAQAVQNLLADKGFYSLIADKQVVPSENRAGSLAVGALVFDASKAFVANNAGESVVTVRTPTGHGSGFFFAKGGYILTNQHVVGEARNVRVMLYNGREISGEVIASEGRRDVAVMKVADEGFPPISMSKSEPAVGSEVYAIGAPLDEKMSGTVSRGIISAYRSEKEQRYIQSDVTIQPGSSGGPLVDAKGNAIGLAVSGMANSSGTTQGLNFFIPISSALEALRVPQ